MYVRIYVKIDKIQFHMHKYLPLNLIEIFLLRSVHLINCITLDIFLFLLFSFDIGTIVRYTQMIKYQIYSHDIEDCKVVNRKGNLKAWR